MDECCSPRCWAAKLLVVGIILILVRLYTVWDIWVVLGVLLIIKAIIMFIMPTCMCQTKSSKKK
jgi:membrane-bound ClpP family serine protease